MDALETQWPRLGNVAKHGSTLRRFELAFLHHALMLLSRALDAILIIAFTSRKLLNDFIEAVGRIAIRVTAAKPDALPSLESMNHGSQASRADMQNGDPLVTARAAQTASQPPAPGPNADDRII